MNIKRFIIANLIMILSLSSCDSIRSMVGKPTSSDIEIIRQAVEIIEKAARDSAAAVKAEQERLSAEAAAVTAVVKKVSPQYDKRYYVIVGSFQQKNNAEKLVRSMEKLGHDAVIFDFKNGYTAVGVCGTNDSYVAQRKKKDLYAVDITPYDIWVYDTSRNLHE